MHEIIRHADAVVGVLKEDRRVGFAVHSSGIAVVEQDPRLLFLVGFAVDEFQNVRMAGIEDHHLRCPAGLAAGLDHARERIKSFHERYRP